MFLQNLPSLLIGQSQRHYQRSSIPKLIHGDAWWKAHATDKGRNQGVIGKEVEETVTVRLDKRLA